MNSTSAADIPAGAAPGDEEELQARAAELTALSRHLILVTERDKAELARELHDTFGSSLTAINMDLNWIARRLPQDRPELQERLQRALRMLRETVAVKQQMIDRLRPSHLDTLGLAVALRAYCRELETRAGLSCEIEVLEDFDGLDANASITLYRLAQEVLVNVGANAKVHLRLVREADGMRLTIREEGATLMQAATRRPAGQAFVSMRERVGAAGGSLRVMTSSEGGAVLEAFLPLHAS